MTSRNTERTGRRYLTRLSGIARQVGNVRHVDLDLVQYCPSCKHPQVFAEVKTVLVSDREWDQARRHAAHYGHGCIAILVVEPEDSELLGVKIYDSCEDTVSDVTWRKEIYLKEILEGARDKHECY